MKHKRKYNILLQIIFIVLIIGCKNNNIEGRWENDDRIIIFDDTNFEIIYMNTDDIKAFKGIYEKINNEIVMKFIDYKDKNEIWKSLEDTSLSGHIEKIKYKIKGTTLETIIVNTGKKYIYHKIE